MPARYCSGQKRTEETQVDKKALPGENLMAMPNVPSRCGTQLTQEQHTHAMSKSGQYYEWLRYQRDREDPVGDFARFVFWDKEAPKASSDPDDWADYCMKRSYPFLIDGFKSSWFEYRHEQNKEAYDERFDLRGQS